jgi:hypothetical protein
LGFFAAEVTGRIFNAHRVRLARTLAPVKFVARVASHRRHAAFAASEARL